MFSFKLDESASKAYDLLSQHVTLPHWDKVCDNWRARKAQSIANLCPETGRAEVQVHTPVQARTVIDALKVEFNSSWVDWVHQQDVVEGTVHMYSALTQHGAKVGQKLTRVLSTLAQKHNKLTANEASARIGKVFDAAKNGTKGNVVLSANILDVLMCSMNCSFSSCYSFTGSYCAGTQQYLADEHTLVAYFYDKEVDGLPYKTWRQFVHVDHVNKAVLFMGHQGTRINDDSHKEVRRLAAKALGNVDAKWKVVRKNIPEASNAKVQLAHVEAPTLAIRLGEGLPKIQLTDNVPCGQCGREGTGNWCSSRLVCSNGHM